MFYLIFLLLGFLSFAEESPEVLLKQQQTLLERQIQDQMFQNNIQKGFNLEINTQDENFKPQETQTCFKLQKVNFNQSKYLSIRTQTKIVKEFIGQCITSNLLNNIIRKVTNYYIAKGFVTSRAVILPQDVKTGNLEVQIIEGRLDEINFDTKSYINEEISAFGLIKNKHLNIRNIEQGLEQMNRLPSNNASMQILPSKKQGYSNILISKNKQDRQSRLSFGLNNAGQESTGIYSGKLIFMQDNILKLNDSITAIYTNSITKQPSKRNSNNFYSNINIPFGAWNFSSSFINSQYLTTINGTNKQFQTSGRSDFQTFKIERKVFRNQKHKIGLYSSLNLKNIQSFIEDVLNNTGSRRLSVLSFDFNHNFISQIGYLNYTISYSQGLKNFGAKIDTSNQNDFTPQAQYQKYNIEINYYKPFEIKAQKFYLTSNIMGQYSQNPLFASEQIIIGDQYSVRGFRAKSALGDDGFFANNNLYFVIPKSQCGITNNTEIFIGYDWGFVKQKGGRIASFGEGSGILSGFATGVKFKGKKLQFDLTYAKTIKNESYIPSGWEVYGNLTFRIF